MFKKFKAVKYGPKVRGYQSEKIEITPQTLLCSSAEDQKSQNKGKPQDGEAPANAQGRSSRIQPRTEQTIAQALTSCSKA